MLFEQITAAWPAWLAHGFVIAALASSAALLFIAAQTGFFGGPRVLANMAVDRWMPTRFATLSDRLVTQNGVLLMGAAALVVVLFTGALGEHAGRALQHQRLHHLQPVATRHGAALVAASAPASRTGKAKLFINGFGLLLTGGILISLCVVKFFEGGWATLLVTGLLIGAAFWVKRHYRQTQKTTATAQRTRRRRAGGRRRPPSKDTPAPCDPNARTAVFLVNGFNGLGLHTLLAVVRMFPKVYQNFVFVQVGVLDAGNFKGAAEVENLREHSRREVERYVGLHEPARILRRGALRAGHGHRGRGGEIVRRQSPKHFPQAQFFAGQLVFKDESLLTRWLHNHTVFELQRRLYQNGWPMLILPIQV